MKVLVIALGLLSGIATAYGQPVSQHEVQEAQDAMLKRISAATASFAKAHDISSEIDTFWLLKLDNEPVTHFNDGFIPFGVNYYNITDRKLLEQVIFGREVYETIYRKRCMAETKNLIGDGN